jgi:RNA polymerase sigma-70 factor (ECF subfamily)
MDATFPTQHLIAGTGHRLHGVERSLGRGQGPFAKSEHASSRGKAQLAQVSDEQLVERYRTGDTPAFEELVRRHHDDLIRFLVRLTGNRAVAEDAFQETFLQVHLSAESFDTSRRFKPWLFTIAANKGRDALRRNARRKALDLSAPIAGGNSSGGDGAARTYVDLMEIDVPPPEKRLDDEEQADDIQQVVDALPWSLREILLLAYFQRMSYNQIADALGIPLGTVKSRLHSAVAAFAKKYQSMKPEKTPPSLTKSSVKEKPKA